jgi:hypothetical protein
MTEVKHSILLNVIRKINSPKYKNERSSLESLDTIDIDVIAGTQIPFLPVS